MNVRRLGLGAGGVLLVVLALGTPVGGTLPVETLESTLGNDLYVIGLVALVGVLVAVPIAVSGRSSTVEEAEMPDPEAAVTVPHAGATIDTELESLWTHLPIVGRSRRATIRARLERCAIQATQRTHTCSQERARELVETGEWTDDERIGRFLADSRRPTLAARIGALGGGTTWFGRSVHLTVDELSAQHESQYSGETNE